MTAPASLQPCYPPLSALVEAQQSNGGSSALQGPHYYFGHRHFNYTAPHLTTSHSRSHYSGSAGSSAAALYDLEWTTSSPSQSRTPAAAVSTSPALSSPLSAEATPGAVGSGCSVVAASPYSSFGSWDAYSSADAAAISPALFYHSPLLQAPDSDAAAAAAAASSHLLSSGASPTGAYPYGHRSQLHPFQQQQEESSMQYDMPMSHYGARFQHCQQPMVEQQTAAPSLDMSRGRRGRKRRCDEAIMALHPSALVAVKDENIEEEPPISHSSSNNSGKPAAHVDSHECSSAGSMSSSALAPVRLCAPWGIAKKAAEHSSESEEDDDDFFSEDDDGDDDDGSVCDGNTNDDADDGLAGVGADQEKKDGTSGRSRRSSDDGRPWSKRNGGEVRRRRKKKVVKVERRVDRRVEVTKDLNIEAHLSPESDGYRWRKYGRKTVKGSPFPRSYFKCTYPHCLVKKQVEAVIRDGHIVSTSSIYKGKHSHDRPCVTQLTAHDQDSFRSAVLAGFADYTDVGSVALSPNNTPRLVVTTEASVDYLDDGYRWRKYGQKYVKGSGYPRSYYKCTDKQCPVKKQVDSLVVGMVVTYEGAHTHAPCLDKASPRKRRRRTAAAPAASRRRPASRSAQFESSAETDELHSSPTDHSPVLSAVKEERQLSFHNVPAHYYRSQQQQQRQTTYDPSSQLTPYHGPGFFPLELKKEKLEEEEEDSTFQSSYYCQPPQQQSRGALGSSEELSMYMTGVFEDLHGEMIDFLLWEESSSGPRYGSSSALPHPHHAGHHSAPHLTMPQQHPYHHHQTRSSSSISSMPFFPPSISSPFSASSSASSSFSAGPFDTPTSSCCPPTSGSFSSF
jgi:hypothetical protein